MTPTIGVILPCGPEPRLLLATLSSLGIQSAPPAGVVLVLGPDTPRSAQPWIEALASARQYTVLTCAMGQPGAVANTALRRTHTTHVLILTAGDRLTEGALAQIRSLAEANVRAGFVCGGFRSIQRGLPIAAQALSENDAIAVRLLEDRAQTAAVFRRDALEAVGGFDENLPTLQNLDLALRMLAAGWSGVSSSELLVVASTGAETSSQGLVTDHIALELLLERHNAVLAPHAETLLYAMEQQLEDLTARHRSAVASRDERAAAIATLTAKREELSRQLPEEMRAGVDFGNLRRTSPISRNWGYERGIPIDRYYIERFLQAHADDIRGAVLEIQEPDYTRRFGADRVTRSDVLDIDPANPRATVLADLRDAPNIADATYDCVILTQTLHVIEDMRRVLAECARILKADGILLVTLPCTSRVCLEYGSNGDFWRLTDAGARALFEPVFGVSNVTARAHGNVLASAAFLYGLACHEIGLEELDADDPYNPLIVTVRAHKGLPGNRVARRILSTSAIKPERGVVLLYHRVARTSFDVHGLAVPPALFEQQIAYLAERCQPMQLSGMAAALREERLPARTVAVTFDDGYLDNFTDACPVLSAHRVPATVFMTTANLTTATPFLYWWDLIAWALLQGSPPSSTVSLPLPGDAHILSVTTPLERRAAHDAVYAAMVPLAAQQRDAVLAALVEWRGGVASDIARRLSSGELQALSEHPGIEIGAHTEHHLALPAHPVDRQQHEIAGSRRCLERVLNRPILTFAYPYGAWTPDTALLVADAGFGVAVTCDHGPVVTGANLFGLPRIEVKATNLETFIATIERAFTTDPRAADLAPRPAPER